MKKSWMFAASLLAHGFPEREQRDAWDGHVLICICGLSMHLCLQACFISFVLRSTWAIWAFEFSDHAHLHALASIYKYVRT